MWRGRLLRSGLAVVVGVIAVKVLLFFRPDDSGGSGGGSGGSGGGSGSGTSVAARWDTKLDLLGDRTGDCAVPIGTTCGTLMQDVVFTLSSLDNDIGAAGTDPDYSDTRSDIQRLETGANQYVGDNCANPVVPDGTATPSPDCAADAMRVTTGLVPLRAELDADEVRAGR